MPKYYYFATFVEKFENCNLFHITAFQNRALYGNWSKKQIVPNRTESMSAAVIFSIVRVMCKFICMRYTLQATSIRRGKQTCSQCWLHRHAVQVILEFFCKFVEDRHHFSEWETGRHSGRRTDGHAYVHSKLETGKEFVHLRGFRGFLKSACASYKGNEKKIKF